MYGLWVPGDQETREDPLYAALLQISFKCMLIKFSRDAVYDHQVSKNRTEEQGGASKRSYGVDRSS